MTIIKKAAISLIISMALFTAFALISYFALFDYIESRFYSRRVIAGIETRVEKIITSIGEYKDNRLEILSAVSEESAIRNSFLINQSREDIFRRENILKTLIEQNIDINFIRVVDEDGRIHYSTNPLDILSSDPTRISYRMPDRQEIEKFREIAVLANDAPAIIFYPEEWGNLFIAYVYSYTGVKRGTIFVYLTTSDLRNHLIQRNIIERNVGLRYLDYDSIVFNLFDDADSIIDELTTYWAARQIVNPYSLYSDLIGNNYSIITKRWGNGFVGYVFSDAFVKVNAT